MAETDKGIFKAILGPILPYFTEALVTGLSFPSDSHFTDTGLKMAVLKGRIHFSSFLQFIFHILHSVTNFDRYLNMLDMRYFDNVLFANLFMLLVAFFDLLLFADLFVMMLMADQLVVIFTYLFGDVVTF